MYNYGDIVLDINENGSDIVLNGSSIELDPTLNMSLMVTVFSNKEWFGNSLTDEKNRIGSNIENIKEVSLKGRKKFEDELKSSLKYLIDDKNAESLDINVRIVGDGKKENKRYESSINIKEPDGIKKNIYWKYAL